MNKKKVFHTRAVEALNNRVVGMKRALEEINREKWETDDAALTSSDVLSVRERKCFDIELSWGGPADYVRVYLENNCVSDVEYHYTDWGEHEEVRLSCKEYDTLVAWARDVFEIGTYTTRGE